MCLRAHTEGGCVHIQYLHCPRTDFAEILNIAQCQLNKDTNIHEGKILYVRACTEWSGMHSQYLHEWILLKFKILLNDNNDKGNIRKCSF